MREFKMYLLRKWLEFRYRNQDDVCCCGDYMHSGACAFHCCRSMKEYTITSEIKRRFPDV